MYLQIGISRDGYREINIIGAQAGEAIVAMCRSGNCIAILIVADSGRAADAKCAQVLYHRDSNRAICAASLNSDGASIIVYHQGWLCAYCVSMCLYRSMLENSKSCIYARNGRCQNYQCDDNPEA